MNGHRKLLKRKDFKVGEQDKTFNHMPCLRDTPKAK